VLDHDAEQIESLRAYGYEIYYGDAGRLDLLEAAGAREAQVLVLAIDDRDKTLAIVKTVRQHFPHLRIFARAFDRVHAYQLLDLGIDDVYREVYGSSLDMGRDVLTALGRSAPEADRATALFRAHDDRMLRATAAHQHDETKLIDISRQARAEIARVLAADRGEAAPESESARTAAERADE
jgi:voltage-gated potassium channel Kch